MCNRRKNIKKINLSDPVSYRDFRETDPWSLSESETEVDVVLIGLLLESIPQNKVGHLMNFTQRKACFKRQKKFVK